MQKLNIHTKYAELQKSTIYRIWFWISEMLQKFIIVYVYHVGGVSSVFHLKVNVVEDLISFGIEQTKVREHFPGKSLL